MIESEWDTNKAADNFAKHGVSFEEAASALQDPFSFTMEDSGYSEEERWITIVQSPKNRLLSVVYTERGEKYRIISARKAEPFERKLYEEP